MIKATASVETGPDGRCSLANMALAAGTNVGPYRIIEPVGRGGMASVYKAYDASLDRYVALKVLPPEFLHDPTFAARFRREAQTIARLEHPQIIPIFGYDIDATTGTPWMAMRLISGGSLSQRIKRGRLEHAECARILKDVGDALDYAHGMGVIHRDVKPQNVLLDDAGRVYLADFGIAKMVESTAAVTQTGMITGTPQYMAPEQAIGNPVDKSVDLYALGIVAYELFTGRVPFSADTPVAVLMKQASEPMPLPPTSEVPEAVTRVILRATAKDPAARWPSAGAFAKALGAAVNPVSMSIPLEATAAMPALGAAALAETVQTAAPRSSAVPPPLPAAAARIPEPAVVLAPPNRPASSGSGLGLVVIVCLALGGAAAAFFAYRTLKPGTPAPLAATAPLPAATAPAVEAATPAAEPATAQDASGVADQAAAAPVAPTLPPAVDTTPEAQSGSDVRRPITPAERRALLGNKPFGPAARRQRIEAMEQARQRIQDEASRTETPGSSRTTARPARTHITLEVEATQPSTGSQVSVLFGEVLIDGRTVRRFPIRFMGASTFARWKTVQVLEIEDVPVTAKEITVAVGLDPGVNEDRIEGSSLLTLSGDETRMSVAVRYYNEFDRSVKFR